MRLPKIHNRGQIPIPMWESFQRGSKTPNSKSRNILSLLPETR